ncbi:hypothetical protein AMJ44_03290 [candidate division WOR-1 bacterium DG_54_3]|uniref:Glycosyltransferase RgtA/B/C/D-like domain-containing protein n=1 Tax=candidate division WOR-1 bacterium DG_54_3 TaxID=1703775 RepID=A0A0S7Y5C0_UNCSA|nr:MAG: hypothetical protein AMJ44_03290 [candidate division WOR-1 bacterium DG_54_3]
MSPKESNTYKIFLLVGFLLFFLFSSKEIGNFYQTGHAGFINSEVGLSHLNTINNGFLKTKLGATNYKVIYDRAPTTDEYYVRYPYLHNLLVSILWEITGPSEIASRLFVIILTFLSIVMFFFISQELNYSKLSSTLVYLTLCSFPIFYHYAGLSNGEISALFPLSLSYYFYIKHLKNNKSKYKFFLFISLSITCQLFWYGYIASLVFFFDSLLSFTLHKQKKDLKMALILIFTVGINISVYVFHTLWLVGSLKNAIDAFLWRASIKMPPTHRFTWMEFILKNLKRWWLFNPVVIFFSLAFLISSFRRKNQNIRFPLNQRFSLMLLLTPLIFSVFLSHLVYYHDFLIIYFAFFLAFSSIDFFTKIFERFAEKIKKNVLVYSYILVLIFFAVFGLFKHTEEKMIDKETDNYELYYICKIIRNITNPEDKFIITIKRVQEPQVRFYLRREAFFRNNVHWAKRYIDSNMYSYCLVETKHAYRPLIKYLLQNFRGLKYDRYFLFDLRKPGKKLRVFNSQKEKTNFLFKYFISPYHQPRKYEEIKDIATIEKIYSRFEEEEDLYPQSKKTISNIFLLIP